MNQGHSPGEGQPESPKLPHAVFISHSSDDSSAAESVCAALEAAGIHCWIAPRDVLAGRPYSGQITEAIRRAEILLLVLSQASNRSKQVLREVERATHFKVDLLAFKIEPVEPLDDLAYFLGVEHWLDGSKPGPPEQHFPSLVRHAIELLSARKKQSAALKESSSSEEPEAESFAHFRILRRPDGSLFRLGKGGMGVTYKAIDTRLDKPVALKVIGAELLNSPQARRRFLREAQTAAKIDHPHVATVLYFGEEGDTYFYAMQFVNGEDLERYVERLGPLSAATALRVTMQVAQALEAAHDQELIHRDIKPGNIMAIANRSGSLDVKLIDFGLARAAKAAGLNVTQLTGTRDFVGSPAFASPEQAEMSELDTRSDIYSLGVTLWYLLSAKRPFSGTVGQVMIAHAVKPPPFEQLSGVPPPLIDLLRRMLAKSREDRPQNPRELQQEIDAVIAKLAAEFSPLPGQAVPEAAPPVAPEAALPPGEDKLELATLLPAVASPSFDGYFGIQIGSLVGDRYRLIEEEREGTGGRLFRATDEKALSDTTAEVALKLLHPGIATDPNLVDLLDNELGVIRNASHPNLVQYIKLERSEAPFLVREWIHGFLLSDLLRWRRSLNSSELLVLLEPLAQTLDFVAGQGLGLVNVSAQKILIGCPAEISRETFPALARGDAGQWSNCSLKLNPLCIAPLLLRSRADWGRQTLVPASRVLSMTQAEAGIRGTKSVWLFGRLIYELLSGHDLPSDNGLAEPNQYTPLPELSEEGNQTLRRACVGTQLTGGFPNCAEFWRALKENIGAASRPTSVRVSPPATPTPSALPPPPPPAPPPKRRLMIWAILGGALIIALGVFAAIRFGGSGSTTFPTPTPTATVAEPTATPTPAPQTNEQLAKTYFDRALEKLNKGEHQAGIADLTEAIRLKPDYAEAYNSRGAAYGALKQYDKVISDCTEAIRLKPDYAEAYNNRGTAYGALKQYDKVISDCTEAIRLKPDFPKPYYYRGVTYGWLQQYDRAISDYNEAIRLKPDDAKAYDKRGDAYDALGKNAEAEEDHKKAKELRGVPSAASTPSSTPVAAITPTPTPVVAATPSPTTQSAIEQASKEQPWVNSLGMKFVPVAGTKVLFSVWDTRVQDFDAFVKQTGYNAGEDWKNPGFRQGPTHPVANVNWDDAKAYCAWLTQEEHASGRLPQTNVYRLPTDEEWSAAVGLGYESGSTPAEKSGRITRVYPWGKQWPPPNSAGNYGSTKHRWSGGTSPVGSFAANQYGLYDMGGNVWQWCEDWYDQGQYQRVLRGASWNEDGQDTLLSSTRLYGGSSIFRNAARGFRCVVAPESSSVGAATRNATPAIEPTATPSPTASSVVIATPTPTASVILEPNAFRFYYNFQPDPGRREWNTEGSTWTERQPSGHKNIWKWSGPVTVSGTDGTEYVLSTDPTLLAFIPNLGCAKTWLLERRTNGTWQLLGEIQSVQ